MATISRYALIDEEGEENGEYDTFDEARAAAFAYGQGVIEYEYEYSDSYIVADYRPAGKRAVGFENSST